MARKIDPHTPQGQSPFETAWQVANDILALRRKTRWCGKSAMSEKATTLIEGLAEEESERAVRNIVLTGGDD